MPYVIDKNPEKPGKRVYDVPPGDLQKIMEAAKSPDGKSFNAAYVCWCRKVPIFFDAVVVVKPKLGGRFSKALPSGTMTVPEYIPADAMSFMFTGFAEPRN